MRPSRQRVIGLLAAVGLAATAATGGLWLVRENRRLARQVRALQDGRAPGGGAGDGAQGCDRGPGDRSGGPAAARGGRAGGGQALALVGALGRALERAEATPPATPPPDWRERRERRQARLRELLGRRADESDEAYRERVLPVMSGLLEVPRSRLEDARHDAEEAADVSADQRTALDDALGDAYEELVAHANLAIAGGDLTPYRRNSRGVLGFVGGVVGIVDGLDERLRGVLSEDQRATMEAAGFDWLEYLAATAPWERVNPPPPPPAR